MGLDPFPGIRRGAEQLAAAAAPGAAPFSCSCHGTTSGKSAGTQTDLHSFVMNIIEIMMFTLG